MIRSTRGALSILAALALATAATILPAVSASAATAWDWTTIPGATSTDLLPQNDWRLDSSYADKPGYDLNTRAVGLAKYCALQASVPNNVIEYGCDAEDYANVFRINSSAVVNNIAVVSITPTDPSSPQLIIWGPQYNGHYGSYFTSTDHAYVFTAGLLNGLPFGQTGTTSTFTCYYNVPCELHYDTSLRNADTFLELTASKTVQVVGGGIGVLAQNKYLIPVLPAGQATPMVPPTAAFSASFTGSHSWSFDASASSAVTGQSVRSFQWTFGDGQTATTSTPTTTHTYADGAAHTASLVVVDSAGTSSASVSRTLTEPDLVVNSTGDAPATNPLLGCDTGALTSNGAHECTLRAAIQALDAGSSSTTVTFSLPAGSTTISPGSALPTITRAHATIQGSTGPTMPVISGAGLDFEGAANPTVTAVSIIGSPQDAIVLRASPNATITSNLIGVTPTGQVTPPRWGIDVFSGGSVTIGGDGAAGNTIVGTVDGLSVLPDSPITALAVTNNAVGVNAEGSLLQPQTSGTWGIGIFAGSNSITGAVVSGNRVGGFGVNVLLLGRGVVSPVVSANQIGVRSDQQTLVGSARVNLRLDGVPGARVHDNQIAGADQEVMVSGSVQASVTAVAPDAVNPSEGSIVTLFFPGDAEVSPGALTGTDDLVANNRIGTAAPTSPARSGTGIEVWNAGDRTTVSGNAVLNVSVLGIDVTGSSKGSAHSGTIPAGAAVNGTVVTGNTVGVAPGSGGPIGIGIRIQHQTAARLTQNTVAGVATGISIASSNTAPTITDNTIGVWTDGVTADPVSFGIYVSAQDVTIGPGNTVGNATTAGVELEATGAHVVGNRIGAARFGSGAAPNAIGVLVDRNAADAVIGATGSGNTIAGNPIGVKLVERGAEIAFNTFGLLTGSTLGNGTAISAGVDASIHDNTIAGSTIKGIDVGPDAVVKIAHNVVYGTAASAGIATHLAAPLMIAAERVSHGTSTRTWLILEHVPTDTGTIEVFGNPSCSDPEGRVPLFTTPTTSESSRVLSVTDRADQAAFTVTVTTAAGTTAFSTCRAAEVGTDVDGDGIPDLVEYFGPDGPNAAVRNTTAAFVGDNQQWVTVEAYTGALANVAPMDDPDPSGHPGVSFPVGLIDWTVTGIEPGSFAQVGFVLPGTAVNAWWKYDPRHSPQFYDYAFSTIKGYGALLSNTSSVLGTSTNVVESVPDGGEGDDDGLENGSVHDPVAPAVAEAATPPATPVVASASVAPTSLAATGTDPSNGIVAAALAFVAGIAVLATRRVRRARGRRPSRRPV